VRDVISYLRARLDDLEAQAPSLHLIGCAGTAAAVAAGERCSCGYPDLLLADVVARRELIEEFAHWLESDLTSERGRGRTHRALLLMAQPWSGRDDFDPYWRVVDA
jgi:hypothetical protein